MSSRKVHWRGDRHNIHSLPRTLCGKILTSKDQVSDDENEVTCKTCQKSDTARQIRDYAEDCKRAGVAVGDL